MSADNDESRIAELRRQKDEAKRVQDEQEKLTFNEGERDERY